MTAILLAMGKDEAGRIIKQLEDSEIRSVARSATVLPAVRIEDLEELIVELEQHMTIEPPLVGSQEGAHGLLSGVVADETLNEMMGEIAGQAPKGIWGKLTTVADAQIAEFLAKEEPQVATYVLSQLDLEKAAAVLDLLPIDSQGDLSSRMLTLKPIGNTAARLIADRLTSALLSAQAEEPKITTHARLGAILNKLERDKVLGIVERIEANSEDDARKLKAYIFSFEEIASLSKDSLSRLFDEVPTDRVATALGGCDASLVELVLSSISPRARRIVESEINSAAAPQKKAILDARRAIASTALALAERGVIQLPAQQAPSP